MFRIFRRLGRTLLGDSFYRRIMRFPYNILSAHLAPSMAKVKGFKMYLNPRDKASFSFLAGSIEEFETEIFEKEIKEGMTVLDIGAHVGYYTLIAAQIVGEGGKVFAFEPSPENFSLLKKNVEVNRLRNVVLVQKAVSKETRKIKLFLSNGDGVTHRICDSGNGRKSILIDWRKAMNRF